MTTPTLDSSSASSVDALVRDAVRGIARYAPGSAPACTIDLADNTNAWGMPPAAARALETAPATAAARYPTLYGLGLKAAIADYVGTAPEMVVPGCGSDDILDAAMRAFGGQGRRIAYMTPTFTMIPVFARINDLEPVEIPFDPATWDIDAERLVDARAAITYLCAPNNPTATAVSRAAIEHVVEHAAGIVVVDEAYAEFAGTTAIDLLARSDRLLVARTLSKAFGLAGLRIGYGVARPALAGYVERAIGPYKVNAIAERCALAALAPGDDARGWVERHARLAMELREGLAARLSTLGFAPLPSQANFLLVPTPHAATLGAALRARGILVRTFTSLAVCGPALRIGVGPVEQLDALVAALEEALDATPGARGETIT